MRIRTDFVTNSSSSNFTIQLKIFKKNDSVIRYLNTGCADEGKEVNFAASPKRLGTCETVSDLIQMIRNSADEGAGFWHNEDLIEDEYEDAEDDETLDDDVFICSEEQFFQKLEQIEDMSEIREIVVSAWEEGMNDDYSCTYTYDLTTGKYTGEKQGTENPTGHDGYLDIMDEHECEMTLKEDKDDDV